MVEPWFEKWGVLANAESGMDIIKIKVNNIEIFFSLYTFSKKTNYWFVSFVNILTI